MAVLDPTQVALRHQSGDSDRYAVFALLNISAGDTADLSQYFRVLKRATLLGITVNGALAAAVSGTTVTIPAGPNADVAILTAYGVASS
jgi:hypothetical protein